MVSLSKLLVNEKAVIRSFTIGRLESNRLASLGLTPGALVNMTQNYGRGPLIVMVRGTRIALGRFEADQILVERNS